ncbi:hypothetical protein MHEI_46490 [Mycobacterium heidelbergense]|nr:hypothetical protein MHEI_46490 [Mycobacterium heidelbergense]
MVPDAGCSAEAILGWLPLEGGTRDRVSVRARQLFIIAVETSQPLPFDSPRQGCKKVAFVGDKLRGAIGVELLVKAVAAVRS